METFTEEIDLTGFFCPLPIIKTAEKIGQMKAGDVLKVTADDPGVKPDLSAFCGKTGHELIGMSEKNGLITLFIRKKNPGHVK